MYRLRCQCKRASVPRQNRINIPGIPSEMHLIGRVEGTDAKHVDSMELYNNAHSITHKSMEFYKVARGMGIISVSVTVWLMKGAHASLKVDWANLSTQGAPCGLIQTFRCLIRQKPLPLNIFVTRQGKYREDMVNIIPGQELPCGSLIYCLFEAQDNT